MASKLIVLEPITMTIERSGVMIDAVVQTGVYTVRPDGNVDLWMVCDQLSDEPFERTTAMNALYAHKDLISVE